MNSCYIPSKRRRSQKVDVRHLAWLFGTKWLNIMQSKPYDRILNWSETELRNRIGDGKQTDIYMFYLSCNITARIPITLVGDCSL